MTTAYQQNINQHYGRGLPLGEQILAALRAAGKDMDALTREDLSSFDEFHIGGRPETRNLAALLGVLQPGMRVLDVGSGLGGPARTLAAEFGVHVTGLDLTAEYCEAAGLLTGLVGLADKATFRQGNALAMPFEDGSFDVVWSQFAGMNIPDKAQLYAECFRVLRKGSYFAFHEALLGNGEPLHYPVFWAEEPSISHLKTPDEIRRTVKAAGFEELKWEDVTPRSADFFKRMLAPRPEGSPAPLNFSIYIGSSVPEKARTLLRNMEEGRVVVVQAVYRVPV